MKYLTSPSNKKMVNLETIEIIMVSNSYLVLVTMGGEASRDIQFVYASPTELTALFNAVMEFVADDSRKVFDCDKFLADFRTK